MASHNRTRKDVVNQVAAATGMTKTAAEEAVAATLEALTNVGPDPLTLRGFGTLRRVTRSPRVLPFTGQMTKGFTTLAFKPSHKLRG